jgi:hypothetical protein
MVHAVSEERSKMNPAVQVLFEQLKGLREAELWQRPTSGLQCDLKAEIIEIMVGQKKTEETITDMIDR